MTNVIDELLSESGLPEFARDEIFVSTLNKCENLEEVKELISRRCLFIEALHCDAQNGASRTTLEELEKIASRFRAGAYR